MFENEYDNWNTIKKKIAHSNKQVFCKTRDIWWCSIGMNIGTEIYGKSEMFERPILVLKVYNKETVLGLPLSTKVKTGTYYKVIKVGNALSNVQLSQGRILSTKRLSRKITHLDEKQFRELVDAYKATI